MAVTRLSQSRLTNPSKYTKMSSGIKAVCSGGTVSQVGGYTVHTFTSNGTFSIDWASENIEIEYLVVAGGAGGGGSGGGGAGGFRAAMNTSGFSGRGAAYESTLSLGKGSYSVVIGAGGSGANGSDSTFDTITSTGGGHGGDRSQSGFSGGAGGGGGSSNPVGFSGGAGTTAQGYNGGGGGPDAGFDGWGGGGGGAGGAGSGGGTGSEVGKYGGAGQVITIIDSATATSLSVGEVSGSDVYFAGGGGPARFTGGGITPGGIGGGGDRNQAGTANTGGGGGAGGAGGSGVVIVRYAN